MIERDFSSLILFYSHIVNKLSEEKVHEIIKDAVTIEKEFIIKNKEPLFDYLYKNTKLISRKVNNLGCWSTVNREKRSSGL